MANPSVTVVSLGVDLGTSSVKAVLAARDGTTVAAARRPLGLATPEVRGAEQDPEDWWRETAAAIRECMSHAPAVRVAGVGLTGQKHALLALDADDRPLGPAVLWADARATEEVREVERRVADLSRRTGAPGLPGYFVPKWLRFRRLHPKRASATTRLCFAKDWIRLRLTGVHATDPTEASASQLYDARRRVFSDELCRLFDVPRAALPAILPSTATTGVVGRSAATSTGLAPGTPVVAGAGDNETAALACGATVPGVVAVVMGTSGTVVATAKRRRPVPGLVWGRHVTRRGLAATGVVLAAGGALEWARRVFFPDASVGDVLEAADRGLAHDGLPVFVPGLFGERSPLPDADATGGFLDVVAGHDRDHLAASVLLGVAASLGQTVDRVREAGVDVMELRLTSGGAASPLWRRLVTAAAQAPARTVADEAGPAWAAALLATVRDGDDRTLEACRARWERAAPLERPARRDVDRMLRVSERLARAREALRRTR